MSVNKKERTLYWVIIILILALAASLYYGFRTTRQKQENFERGVELQSELSQVMDDYTSVRMENQDLAAQMTEKDSIIMANQAEIKKLIATQADYNKIKKKLEHLRRITQEYVARIDSLVTANEVLTEENIQMKEEVNRVNRENTRLNEDKRQLLDVASEFKAYNLVASTLRVRGDGKETPTDKARRITRISIDFTLSENKVVEAGQKVIYARIARPDGVIMAVSDDDAYSFELDGKTLQYSVKQEVDYKNQAQTVRMIWDRLSDGAAMGGKYDVVLYMEGKEIGRTGFLVRD